MFARTDTSILGQWWWTVDRWMLGAIVFLLTIGTLLVVAASPAVAETISISSFYFVKRHLAYLVVSFITLVAASLLPIQGIKKLCFFLFYWWVPGASVGSLYRGRD